MSAGYKRTPADLLNAAKSVAAIADRYADEGDKLGKLSAPVVDALHEEGLFGTWVRPELKRSWRNVPSAAVFTAHAL
jgi:hypothetical protein